MDDAAWPDDALEVGRIVEAWGLKGWFRVQAYAAEPQTLLSVRRWHLRSAASGPSSSAVAALLPRSLDIREAREHGEGLVAAARGIDDRNAAESLRGARIFVGRSSFPVAAKDEFYWADLIGMAVVNRAGEHLGAVTGLLENGPQSVLRIAPTPGDEGNAATERLIPFVAACVDDVDLGTRRIVVDWGLDY